MPLVCALRDIRDNGEGRLAMQPPPTLNTGLHLTWKINTCFLSRNAQDVHTHTANVTATPTPTPTLTANANCQRQMPTPPRCVVATSPIRTVSSYAKTCASIFQSRKYADQPLKNPLTMHIRLDAKTELYSLSCVSCVIVPFAHANVCISK